MGEATHFLWVQRSLQLAWSKVQPEHLSSRLSHLHSQTSRCRHHRLPTSNIRRQKHDGKQLRSSEKAYNCCWECACTSVWEKKSPGSFSRNEAREKDDFFWMDITFTFKQNFNFYIWQRFLVTQSHSKHKHSPSLYCTSVAVHMLNKYNVFQSLIVKISL